MIYVSKKLSWKHFQLRHNFELPILPPFNKSQAKFNSLIVIYVPVKLSLDVFLHGQIPTSKSSIFRALASVLLLILPNAFRV